VALGLSLTTGLVSPQFHVQYDSSFSTVKDNSPSSQWQYRAGFVTQREKTDVAATASTSTGFAKRAPPVGEGKVQPIQGRQKRVRFGDSFPPEGNCGEDSGREQLHKSDAPHRVQDQNPETSSDHYLTNILTKEVGFIQFKTDVCVFFKGNVVYLLYTDDSILAAPSKKEIESVTEAIKDAKLNITVEVDIQDFLGDRRHGPSDAATFDRQHPRGPTHAGRQGKTEVDSS
jgi:hypothetical protein